MESKRIAVIGAGPSGLVTVKELLEEGHRPTCFEQADSLGGVFRYDEHSGVVWASCRLTSSGVLTAFSDFPVSAARREHMTIAEYVAYLSEYCATFGIEQCIHYATVVAAVRSLPHGGWEVEWSSQGRLAREHFDAVAVCSGLHQYPHVPRFAGVETFPNEILHAARYRRRDQVAGKRVLVVGAGESGADIAAEVAGHAAETVLSVRRGAAVVSRCAFGKPRDYLTSRISNAPSHWVYQTRNPADNRQRTVYRYAGLPVVIIDKVLQILQRAFWEILPLFSSMRWDEIKLNFRARKLIQQLLDESGGMLNEQFGTKDDCFVRAMAAGKCRKVPAIDRFEGSCVRFMDDSRFEPDLVLLCTGFETRVPFLDQRIASARRYLNTFVPEAGESLAFVGFVRPGFGAIPPLSELQARWFALVQSGRRRLPPRESMAESIERWSAFHRHIFRPVADRLAHLVDFTVFCDELAAQVGCKPSRQDLRRESLSFRLRFHAGPFAAAQYRLVGPNAKPELARQVIATLPVAHPLPELVNLYLRWTLCRVLHGALGPQYAPKLMLQ